MSIYPQKQNIKIERGDDYNEQFHLGVDITGDEVVFTIKESKYDTDAEAKIKITRFLGLVTVNGAAAPNPALGVIQVDSDTAGTITVFISYEVTELLESETGYWYFDFQVEQS